MYTSSLRLVLEVFSTTTSQDIFSFFLFPSVPFAILVDAQLRVLLTFRKSVGNFFSPRRVEIRRGKWCTDDIPRPKFILRLLNCIGGATLRCLFVERTSRRILHRRDDGWFLFVISCHFNWKEWKSSTFIDSTVPVPLAMSVFYPGRASPSTSLLSRFLYVSIGWPPQNSYT